MGNFSSKPSDVTPSTPLFCSNPNLNFDSLYESYSVALAQMLVSYNTEISSLAELLKEYNFESTKNNLGFVLFLRTLLNMEGGIEKSLIPLVFEEKQFSSSSKQKLVRQMQGYLEKQLGNMEVVNNIIVGAALALSKKEQEEPERINQILDFIFNFKKSDIEDHEKLEQLGFEDAKEIRREVTITAIKKMGF